MEHVTCNRLQITLSVLNKEMKEDNASPHLYLTVYFPLLVFSFLFMGRLQEWQDWRMNGIGMYDVKFPIN